VRPSKLLTPFLSTRYWWTEQRSVASNVARLAAHSEESREPEPADSGDDLEIYRKDREENKMAVIDKTKYAIVVRDVYTDSGYFEIVATTVLKKDAQAFLNMKVPNPKTRRFEYKIIKLSDLPANAFLTSGK